MVAPQTNGKATSFAVSGSVEGLSSASFKLTRLLRAKRKVKPFQISGEATA
jgi:hypothetical protein